MERTTMIARRNMLSATVGFAACLAAPVIRRAAAKSGQNLRIGYVLPLQSHLGAGATAFADEITKQTTGRITVQQFPDSLLGGEVELAKGVQLGSIDLAFVTGVGLPGNLPEIGVFNIPFLFNSAKHAYAVFDGPIGESFLKKFAGKEIVALGWGENGVRHMTNARHAIVKPEDLKGLKMRVPQSDVLRLGFQAFGAEASLLAFPQLFEALRSGKFDGEENPIATIRAAKFDQVQKFLSLSAHSYDPAVFIMSQDAFEDLSAEDKLIFAEAANAGGKASRSAASQAEVEGVAALQQAGMTVQREIDRPAFIAAMAGIYPEFEKRFGRELIEQIKRAE
jgi:tripartite ATP-independent transporter DctP family solute receptor